ncbi:MAG: hypothetical protein WBA29_06635 [Xanthobacteraceae bacterium]
MSWVLAIGVSAGRQILMLLCGDDALSAPRGSGWRDFVLLAGFRDDDITELVAPDHRRGPNRVSREQG